MFAFKVAQTVRIIATSAVIILFATGCKKSEGEYAAKKKITAVYSQSSGWYTSYNEENGSLTRIEYNDPKYQSEEWVWEKGRLMSITYLHQDGSSDGRESFSYSGGNLTAKENRSAGVKTTFTYNGDKIQAIKCFVDGHLYSTSEISHTSDKISCIVTTVFTMGSSNGKSHRSISPPLAPYFNYSTRKDNSTQSPIYSEKLVLNWNGDNIASVESYNGERINCIWHYTYDSKENPLFNFWTKEALAATTLPSFGSKNNIVSSTMVADGIDIETYSFQYQYDGKYPVKEIRYDSNTPNSQYPREESVSTEYTYK